VTALWLAERDGEEIAAASLAALRLARSAGADVVGVVFGPDEVATPAGVASVCRVESPELTGYAPVAWAKALWQLAGQQSAGAVVAAGTDRGAEVMAHLGALSGLPVAAGCVSAEQAGPGSWRLVRQRWAGSVLEEAILEAPVALLATAIGAPADEPAPGPAVPAEPSPPASVSWLFTPQLEPADLTVLATESAGAEGGESLATARVVVGGGRGVGGPEGFAALEELAALLGGVVGVSRVVTSAGWRPHRQQVGQTGTKISPELYVACGISGAIQHMAGCASARHIIAVNTDPEAPIIARADYAVIGDLHELIPALVAAIRERAASA
jgi:electron transfer flavoprotein alpha subunit